MKKVNLSNFNEVENLKLRVYNRVITLYNTSKSEGKEVGEEYLAQFDEHERQQMYLMTEYIKFHGLEKVTQELVLKTEPTAPQEEEHVDVEEEVLEVVSDVEE
tara:strand:+ start:1018 stop:1326 length:309 start_codon:yes stop_codon:yes gene_type:complete